MPIQKGDAEDVPVIESQAYVVGRVQSPQGHPAVRPDYQRLYSQGWEVIFFPAGWDTPERGQDPTPQWLALVERRIAALAEPAVTRSCADHATR
jgi:hypothetical protein